MLPSKAGRCPQPGLTAQSSDTTSVRASTAAMPPPAPTLAAAGAPKPAAPVLYADALGVMGEPEPADALVADRPPARGLVAVRGALPPAPALARSPTAALAPAAAGAVEDADDDVGLSPAAIRSTWLSSADTTCSCRILLLFASFKASNSRRSLEFSLSSSVERDACNSRNCFAIFPSLSLKSPVARFSGFPSAPIRGPDMRSALQRWDVASGAQLSQTTAPLRPRGSQHPSSEPCSWASPHPLSDPHFGTTSRHGHARALRGQPLAPWLSRRHHGTMEHGRAGTVLLEARPDSAAESAALRGHTSTTDTTIYSQPLH